MKQWMEMELCSDLCVSNGENYSAWIDNDICYDEYGLPLILAKRLKGCIREVAQELADWNAYVQLKEGETILVTEEIVNRIFGMGGEASGTVKLTNGILREYESYIEEIETSPYEKYLSPQNVLDTFSYVRAQTAIEAISGVAKPETLRFTRVLKKGLHFIFSYEVENTEEAAVFQAAARALRQMGLNRNRGMGKIKIYPMKPPKLELQMQQELEQSKAQLQTVMEKLESMEKEERAVIQYILWSDTELLFPTGQNGDRSTETYIPGANIMGFLAWEYQKCGGTDFYSLFQSGKVQFKNAYISDGIHRFRPACSCYFIDKDVKTSYCYNYMKKPEQKWKEEDTTGNVIKRKPLLGTYVFSSMENGLDSEQLQVVSVDTQWNSHIRRNVKKREEKELYQFSSINRSQCFAGEIVGAVEDLKELIKLFPENGKFYLGRSSSAQYGMASLLKIDVNSIDKKTPEKESKKFMIEFAAPVILFNKEKLVFETTENLLKETLANLWKIEREEIQISGQSYQYRTYGGFNRKWQMHKPQVQAFDKGTSFLVEITAEKPIILDKHWVIGERISEGFGELYAVDYEQMRDHYKMESLSTHQSIAKKRWIQNSKLRMEDMEYEVWEEQKDDNENFQLIELIAKRIIKEKLELNAMRDAKKHKISNPTTIGKLEFLVKQCPTWEEFFQQICWIKDNKKKKNILESFSYTNKKVIFKGEKEEEDFILKEMKKFLEKVLEQACEGEFELFKKQYHLNEVYQIYLSAYFRQAKYEERMRNLT